MFTPLTPRISVVDACAASLRRAILSGELKPGARLPPERALAEQFGVNRVTVRSALARLAVGRLLSVRQGSGYVVRDYLDGGGPDLLPGLADLAGERGELAGVFEDLLLVRRQLARAVLERLTQAAPSDHALADFAAAVDSFEALAHGARPTTDQLTRADLAVVQSLLAATGSVVLQLCLNPVTAVLGQSEALREALYHDPKANLGGWRLLQAWLQAPDPAAIDPIMAAMRARDADTLTRLASRPGDS